MNEEEKQFCLKLIYNLFNNPNLTVVDTCNIRDYFWFKFIEIYKKNDKNEAREWVDFFEKIEGYFTAQQDFYLPPDEFHTKVYSGIFLTLAQILSLKFGVKKLPSEAISRKEFEKSFQNTLKKLI